MPQQTEDVSPLEKDIGTIIRILKELDYVLNELRNDKKLQDKKQVLNEAYTKIQALKTISVRAMEENFEREDYIEILNRTLEKLWALAEPPYWPAIFKQSSEIKDPRKEAMEKRKQLVNWVKCWLIPINGQDVVGTIEEKLSKEIEPGQFVLVNKDYVVINPIPPNETGNFVTLNEGTVTGVSDNLIMVKDSSGTTIKATILSLDLQKELAEKPLDQGDRVLFFGNIVVKILERLKLITTKENFRKADFADIGGLDEQIEEIENILGLGFDRVAWKIMKGNKTPKGVIVFGPPGCGKTLLARALTTKLGWHLEVINGPEILNKFIGTTEENMRNAFNNAKKHQPAILYIDEADSIFPIRGTSTSTEHTASYVAQYNVIMDGVEQLEGVFVILATNRIDKLDTAVMREGRLDKKIEIPPPRTREKAEAIVKIYLKNQPIADLSNKEDRPMIIEKWAKMMSAEIFDSENNDTRLFTAFFNRADRDFNFKEFISGAFIAAMIDALETKALKRLEKNNILAGDPKFGIIEEDLNDLVSKTIVSSVPKEERAMINWMLNHGYSAPNEIRYNKRYFPDS